MKRLILACSVLITTLTVLITAGAGFMWVLLKIHDYTNIWISGVALVLLLNAFKRL